MTQLAIDNPSICWVLRKSRGTDLGRTSDCAALSSSPGGTFPGLNVRPRENTASRERAACYILLPQE